MMVSLEDAVRLLRKWYTDGTLVTVVATAGSVSVSVCGFISDCSPEGFAVTHTTEDRVEVAKLLVGIEDNPVFEYKDLTVGREPNPTKLEGNLKGTMGGTLTMKSESGLECKIYEFIV